MESSEGDRFVDHKEIVISAPRPRQMSASKVDLSSPEDTENMEGDTGSVLTECQVSVSTSKETVEDIDTNLKDNKKETALSCEDKSVTVQEVSSETHESSSTKTVTKYATTIYTQRISGRTSRSSRSSDSSSDISSPSTEPSTPVFGSTTPVEAHSPTEICSVQFNVAAGVTSTTTTAFSKMFTKTVDATTEVRSKERHLSECSISIGGPPGKPHSQETSHEQSSDDTSTVATESLGHETENQEQVNDASVFTETFISMKPEEEKEVAEYSPGLAIRTLTLEDLQEKRLSPERESELNDTHIHKITDMSTSFLSSQPFGATQQKGFFSSYADSASNSVSMPTDMSQGSFLSSEYNTSQMLASQSSTSMTSSTASSSLTSGGQVLMQCTEDFAAPVRKPLFNPIEVERKFTMTEDTEERLKSLGARLHKEKTFTDIYYDNDDYALIITDCWLRRRNDCWEAKVPLKSQNTGAVFSPASQYKEISNEREISTWLVDHLGLETWMRGDPVDLLAQAAGLTEFAKFTTTRRSYTLPFCVVNVELTDHGFRVGEIEVMAASPEELPQALQTINGVAQQLGLSPLTLV